MKIEKAPVKILMADDHEMLRDGFRSFIISQPGLLFVAEAANGRQLIELALLHKPDVIFTDVMMPVMDGIEATGILTAQLPQTGIIAFTMFNNDKTITKMLEAGAKGYLVKTAGKPELLDAIETVAQNKYYYCNATDLKLAKSVAGSSFNRREPINNVIFSQKEKEIIRLICQEYFNKEISEALHVSIRTVEGHRERIMQKINARNTVGLAIHAIRYGIFVPEGM